MFDLLYILRYWKLIVGGVVLVAGLGFLEYKKIGYEKEIGHLKKELLDCSMERQNLFNEIKQLENNISNTSFESKYEGIKKCLEKNEKGSGNDTNFSVSIPGSVGSHTITIP